MDRDKRGKSPGESGSFDLAKMSVADVAATIAQRMARVRRARKAPDAPARAPPAAGPAAQSPAATRRPAFASQEAMIMAARIARAQHKAAAVRAPQTETITILFARRAPSFGGDFRSLLAEGPNLNVIDMRLEHGEPPRAAAAPALRGRVAATWRALEPLLATRIDQTHRRVHALGVAVRQTAAAIAQLKPALERGIGLAVQRVHALGSMAWQWLVPALERGIDRVSGRSLALAVAVRELSIALWQRLGPALSRTMHQAWLRIGALGITVRELSVALWQRLGLALARTKDQAGRLSALGIAARAHGLARSRQLILALASFVDHAQRHAHAIGGAARALAVATWRAPASQFVMAGATVSTAAIATWCLMQPHETVPPAVVPPPIAGPPPVLPTPQGAGTPMIDHAPSQVAGPPTLDHVLRPPGFTPAEPSSAPEASGLAEAFPAPRLKPPLPLPTLVAELKPAQRTPKPQPHSPLIEEKPLPPLLMPPRTRESPGEMRDDPRAVDNMLGDMVGIGVKHKQRRRR